MWKKSDINNKQRTFALKVKVKPHKGHKLHSLEG